MVYTVGNSSTEVYNFNVDPDGKLTDSNGNTVDITKAISDSEKVLADMNATNAKEFGTTSFCSYAISALCGTGGGVACYAAAGALGITTGVGGLGLAAVCSLISSLGCSAATDRICG
jgi:halocin C8-like bacteriocin domain-containing protein